jgi:hypothetical protein
VKTAHNVARIAHNIDDAESEVANELLQTSPTSIAGVLALLRYLDEVGDDVLQTYSDDDVIGYQAVIATLVKSMSAMELQQQPAAPLYAVVATNPAKCVRTAPDPIFAAIENHRAAYAAWITALHASSDIEQALPPERHKWSYAVYSPEPPADCTDDPKYLAAALALRDTGLREIETVMNMIETRPITPKASPPFLITRWSAIVAARRRSRKAFPASTIPKASRSIVTSRLRSWKPSLPPALTCTASHKMRAASRGSGAALAPDFAARFTAGRIAKALPQPLDPYLITAAPKENLAASCGAVFRFYCSAACPASPAVLSSHCDVPGSWLEPPP